MSKVEFIYEKGLKKLEDAYKRPTKKPHRIKDLGLTPDNFLFDTQQD